jgi:hypothetical protein
LRAYSAWKPRILRLDDCPSDRENQAQTIDDIEEDESVTPTVQFVKCVASWWMTWSIDEGLSYLARTQRPDGSWLPLWFGNQHAPDHANPTYGTARVLAAYRDLDKMNDEPARRGIAWLLAAQNADGGWGGAPDVPSSIEETALAVEILLAAGPQAETAVNSSLAWLVEQVEVGGLKNPTPIGFYFAKLWYYEKLYPIIFAVAALGRAVKKFSETAQSELPPDHHEGSPEEPDRGDRC